MMRKNIIEMSKIHNPILKTNDSNVIEFISEIATQLTELKFHEETFWFDAEQNQLTFTDEAQDFFNERYDEVETLFTNLILNSKKQ